MKVALRAIQGVAVGRWQQKEDLGKRSDVVDKPLVGAVARHHRGMFAGCPAAIFVKEWQALGDEDVET